MGQKATEEILIDELIDIRKQARENNDFKKADEIRGYLDSQLVFVFDAPQGEERIINLVANFKSLNTHKMIVKVENSEAEIIEYMCAIMDLKFHKFTMENNPNLVQVEVTHQDKKELDSETTWWLCASVQTKLAIKNL